MIVDDDGVIQHASSVFLRAPYNYSMDDASRASGLECLEPTMAQQQFKEECDINTILDRFGITGTVPTNVMTPIQAEFIEAITYQESLDKIREADAAFMQMPAKIRERFQNDPGQFLDFVSNEANRTEAIAMGLVLPPAAPQGPLEVRVVADVPPAGPVST